MDALAWLGATGLGLAVGLTGLLPGFHVNTLVALALAIGWADPAVAVAIVAAASAHAFFGAIPATYVGVPGDDAGLSTLPAHALAREGKGPEAVAACLDGALLATVLAIVLLLPVKWLLDDPVRLGDLIGHWMPWIIAAALLMLAAGEWRKGWTAVGAALLLQGAAGLFGALALRLRFDGLVAVPAAGLLPLFGGLFGTAGLVASLATRARLPPQERTALSPRTRVRNAAASTRGVLAAVCTISVPGLTPGVGATLAYGRDREDVRPAIAALSATGTAHQVLSIGLLFVTLRSRTGLAAGIGAMVPIVPWDAGQAPSELVALLAAALASGLAAWALVSWLNVPVAHAIRRIPGRLPDLAAFAVVLALVAVLAGWTGLFVLAAATALGLVPIVLGLRRVHLVACIGLPILAARVGLTP